MNLFKQSCLKQVLFYTILSASALINSCDTNNTNKSPIAKKEADTTKQVAGANAQSNGLTLPVLDALFFEEGFEQELKSKLQLSAGQLEKLKAAAWASVADLTEDGTGDYLGSARSAAKQSEAQIRSILGDDKAQQLFQLVNQRYASGDVEGLMPTQPNSVPKDTRIVVNAPAYRMDVFENGKLLKSYKVGIGYPEFPLPTGMRRADNIIFNPTWTPPDEPWVKGKVQAGKKVAAGSKLNPLGPIKIPIGLPSLIHGGKAVAKLGSFASHGCVGLTNDQVQDFAGMLSQLSGSPVTADSIMGFQQRKTVTKTVKLNKAVPVELRYETIVVQGGALHIYRDVYEHGTNTRDNASHVLAVYGVKYESLSAQEQTALTQALSDMNRDPQGNSIDGDSTSANKVAGNSDDGMANPDKSVEEKKTRAKKGKVTRGVVGQKEVIVPVVVLQGKGYPEPVNLDAGAAKAPVVAGSR